jgi:hypothetical protein
VSRTLDGSEGESSEFPHHAGHLVLVLVQPRNPPLAPLVDHWQSELVLHAGEPGHSAGDGHAVVDIALSDPDPEAGLDEDGVEPVAGICEHGVVGAHRVAAGFELGEGHVEAGLDAGLVEEMGDPVHILADDVVGHQRNLPVRQSHVFGARSNIHLLVEALRIKVEHASISRIEFLIGNLPDVLAALALISHDAGSLDIIVLFFSVVSVIE